MAILRCPSWSSRYMAVLVVGVVGVSASFANQIEFHSELRQVDSFERTAWFLAKDFHFWALDVSKPGVPKPVFKIFDNKADASEIAVATDSKEVFIAKERSIWLLNPEGKAQEMIDLDKVQDAEGLPASLKNHEINWLFKSSPTGKDLYFALLARIGRGHYICHLNRTTGKLKGVAVGFPSRVALDMNRGIAYIPGPITSKRLRTVGAVGLDAEMRRNYKTLHDYMYVDVSDDGGSLLLSTLPGALSPAAAMAKLNVATGEEVALPVSGCCASLGKDGSVFFLGGPNSLWQLPAGPLSRPKELISIEVQEASPSYEYAMRPVLSSDGSWLAWCWAMKMGKIFRCCIVLIDLSRGTFRVLEGFRYNDMAWLVP